MKESSVHRSVTGSFEYSAYPLSEKALKYSGKSIGFVPPGLGGATGRRHPVHFDQYLPNVEVCPIPQRRQLAPLAVDLQEVDRPAGIVSQQFHRLWKRFEPPPSPPRPHYLLSS
mmetsp:Transcript_75631/g.210094  ORF Transcript_75631/g.210094 Transcript_75631/m.210094 type:complete len:114 (+) Transcript_75631:93-434(+)